MTQFVNGATLSIAAVGSVFLPMFMMVWWSDERKRRSLRAEIAHYKAIRLTAVADMDTLSGQAGRKVAEQKWIMSMTKIHELEQALNKI